MYFLSIFSYHKQLLLNEKGGILKAVVYFDKDVRMLQANEREVDYFQPLI